MHFHVLTGNSNRWVEIRSVIIMCGLQVLKGKSAFLPNPKLPAILSCHK